MFKTIFALINFTWIQLIRLDLIPEVKISAIGKEAKIIESFMRQYVSGKAAASDERAKLIERAIHELGKELQSVP